MLDSAASTQSIKYQQTQQKVTTIPATNITTKRVKVTLACTVCRKKKVKCDGIQPSCSRCNSMGISCEYSDPPKKRGPPKSQVEIIESRARRIESLRVANGMSETHTVSTAPVTHGSNGFALIGDFFNTGENTLFSLENNTVLRLISGAVDAVETNKYSSSSLVNQQQSTPGSHYIKNDFFVKDDPLVNDYRKWTCCYFGHFNVFFPLLSQPHYMQQLSQQKVDPLLFYAVCAIGSKYSDDGLETSRLLFARCQYFLNMSRDSTTLSTVQALVLLCWYSYLMAKMETCGELRQTLNQAVNDLQLYRDPSSSLGIMSIEMYRRAFWVAFVTDQWLSCCTGERFLILPDGRNCQRPQLEDSQLFVIGNKQWHINTNHDDMVHTQKQRQQQQLLNDSPDTLPHLKPDLSAEYVLQITAFVEMIKLACIVDEMHDLYAPSSKAAPNWHHYQVLVSRLTHWLVHLPSYLEYGKPKDDSAPSPIARIYHMLYYTVQIMLHHPFLQQQQLLDPMTIKSAHASSSSAAAPDILMARSICTNAANTIVHISEQMIQHKQHMYLHNTFMISLTLASSVQLDNVIHSDQTHDVPSLLNLGKSFDVLKNCNCSVLSPMELDKLLNRFLLDHYGIRLGGTQRTPSQPTRSTCHRANCVKKRTLATSIDDTSAGSTDHAWILGHPRKRHQHTASRSQPSCTVSHPWTLPSPTKVKKDEATTISSPQDDLLDTRLCYLLSQDAQQQSYTTTNVIIPSPSTSSSAASNVLDPSWLDETSSILDLFPAARPSPSLPSPQCYASDSNSSSPSKLSGYATSPVESLYSPISFISPTQSPTLSSPDSNLHTTMMSPMNSNSSSSYTFNNYGMDYHKLSGQYSYPFPPPPPLPVTIDIFAFMSDAAGSLPHPSLIR